MVNFVPGVPWYRRIVWGDRWPNKTSWKVAQGELLGCSIMIERHTKECTCSYCRGEHGHGFYWMPKNRGGIFFWLPKNIKRNKGKARGWHVLNIFHRLYIRWTMPF